MSQRKLYSVNSDGKISGTSSDFQFILKNLPSNNKFNKISLVECMLSKTYYNVLNTDLFTLVDVLNPFGITISLPSGFYTSESFNAALVILLNVVSPTLTYSMTNNSLTGLNVISSTNNFTINATKYIAQYIGIEPNVTITADGSNNMLCDIIANMQRYSELQIHCNLASNYNDDILYSVFPSSYLTGDVVFKAEDPEATCCDLTNNNTNLIHITVTDLNGNVVDLNKQDVKLILLFWEEK